MTKNTKWFFLVQKYMIHRYVEVDDPLYGDQGLPALDVELSPVIWVRWTKLL